MTRYAPKSFRDNAAFRKRRNLDAASKILRRRKKELRETIDARGGQMSEEGLSFLNGLLKAVGNVAKRMGGR